MDEISASDLVGCQYRLRQRRDHPNIPKGHAAQERARRFNEARQEVADKLPTKSDSRRIYFRRCDLGPLPAPDPWLRSLQTMEAIAAGYTHITGAVFSTPTWVVGVDCLVREGDTYTPVVVSNHRVARSSERSRLPGVPTHRLGLSEPLQLRYRPRHHPVDGYQLGLAARGLAELGVDSGRGGLVGQDRSIVFFFDTARYQPALTAALQQPVPTEPRRVKECASCRFWSLCEKQLRAVDEISLFLPGDRARSYRDNGIHTVQGLIDADLGEASQLARAWREGIPVLQRAGARPEGIPRAEVEIDIDMEAYLDHGAYLWGAWYADKYHSFATWSQLGGSAEAANFAEFWNWLMAIRDQAAAEGRSFRAYCYSAHGENHWMRMSARRFGTPTPEEVEEFIASEHWIDVFAYVKKSLVGPSGIGLKVIAPEAGFSWRQEDIDGEESVNARRRAVGSGPEALSARESLLMYNADDVQATRVVREWLSAGAPGIPSLEDKSPR